MSKVTVQRKSTLKKFLDRDSSICDRSSDNGINQRRPCYQLIQKEKQRKCLSMKDIRQDQLDILREILFNQRDINELIKKSNRSDKIISKNNIIHNGKTHLIKKTKLTSAKNINSSNPIDLNQSEEDNLSVHSDDEEIIENEPVRVSRSNRKDNQVYPIIRSSSLYSQSRQQLNGIRSTNSVSFMSNRLKKDGQSNNTESNTNTSSDKLKKLLDRLSLELNDLESITGLKSNTNILSSPTCSTALATGLITLTNHVKQYVSNSKGNQDINHFKDQLSVIIKNQLDFQKKIENQMITLQTMMQTICQLVNSEIISNKKCEEKFSLKNIHQDQTDLDRIESHQNWLNNAQRPYIIPKDANNIINELLLLTRCMNNATPIDTDLYHQHTNNSLINHHSSYIETLDTSKKLIRSTSSMSTNETNANEISKQIQQHKNIDQEPRSSMISPIDTPLSYDMFEPGLPNGNSSVSRLRNGINGLDGTSTNTAPSVSINETLLEKILHERLRLVQQMAELNKQHEMTQEELANLEAKTIQSQTIEIKK
ncbi:unnamed protein product [Rotaria sordida]|uniref:Uncharacterized protein n=1 Tax=Rotaria sordida TaxID=392033 RepID=A0A814I3P4_9BILA|nr:unnamed protein product [Rotaria sordida]CAF1197042.1 unnamed protein product [Rotaria sordida]